MPGDVFGLSGQVIEGQFRVDHPIGEGGFSLVYRGQHLGLDESVAIKCLKLNTFPDTATIESFSRRFRDEGRIAYRLSQGNLDIVRSITAGTTVAPTTGALVPYMVLEWLDGAPLGADLRQRRAKGMQGRTLEEVIELFEPAAAAIAYAHGQGIVHRDIKPGNLYLTRTRTGATRLKVLDFGLAKVMDDGIGFVPTAQTLGTQSIICSFPYGAPEQFDPRVGPIGPWTDVYSFALLILEALRDKRVRTGEGLAQCALQAISPEYSMTCHALGLRVAPQVEVALARAVAIDPNVRQGHVGELWEQLKTAMTASSRRRASKPEAAGPIDANIATVWDPRGAAMLDPQPTAAASPPSAPFQGTAIMLDAPVRPSAPSPLASTAAVTTSAQAAFAPPPARPPAPPPVSPQQPGHAPRYAASPPALSYPPPHQIAPPLPPLPAIRPSAGRGPLIAAVVVGAVALVAVLALLLVRMMAQRHG
jgi:serine/threonine protein kinase